MYKFNLPRISLFICLTPLLPVFPISDADAAIAQTPLFFSVQAPPIVLLTMGRDHKLYYEAYNDASDLNDDGVLDTHYKPAQITYTGYFDSYKCYNYATNKFTPASNTANKQCAGAWSGDFLNYLTTSRMDALRKVLYGGYRSTDTTSQTILQRVYIPQDAHSWGKEYTSVAVDGYDISKYTPLALPAANTRHLFASTTLDVPPSPPVLRVLTNKTNRIWEWVSKERPVADNSLGTPTDYQVFVDVCVSDATLRESNCKAYRNGTVTTYKPTGLLQRYGEDDLMAFGLLSGSYKKNTSGGVLRKNIVSFKNEIDPLTGIFTSLNDGIVNTINRFRIESFRYSDFSYSSGWIVDRPINEGEAAEWGNPVSEMMYEGLRYFAGKATPTTVFSSGVNAAGTPDNNLGLPLPTWTNPYASPASGGFLSCAKPIQLVISDINPSYDTDQLPGSWFNAFSGDLSGLDVSALADTIWANESEPSSAFIGQNGTLANGAPTAKAVSSFKNIRGIAPEEPTKLGGYYSGSVALYGRQTDLNAADGPQKVETMAVALASPLPRISMPVGNKRVTLVPFAKSVGGAGIDPSSAKFQPTNQIVDFYVENIVNTNAENINTAINGGRPYGKFRINYEDVEQAADHDMDAIVEYIILVNASNQIEVTLNSTYAAGGIIQHMGYVISGTNADGTYLEVRDLDTAAASDPDYFLDTPPNQLPGAGWNDFTALPLSNTRTFTIGNSASAGFINHDPLWYAAKWGARDSIDNNLLDQSEWDNNYDGTPDNYFLVTNASKLAEQLDKAFLKLSADDGAASAVAANTSRLDTKTLIYQARFNPKDWSGDLYAIAVDTTNGNIDIDHPDWKAADVLPAFNARHIFSYNPSKAAGARGIEFLWTELSKDTDVTAPEVSQQSYLNTLNSSNDGNGSLRLAWLRGDDSHELKQTNGIFRNRSKVLGDIIDSDPVFVWKEDYGFDLLPGTEGSSYLSFRTSSAYLNRTPMIYLGANDGMFHGFDARKNEAGVSTGGIEKLAYVPNALIPQLSKLSYPGYVHQNYVDGLTGVSDVYSDLDNNGTTEWHTLLAGTTGAGGKAVFALDVTYPDTFSKTNVLWEFTYAATSTTNTDPDLGYSFAQPAIGKLKNGSWAVMVGNGYNSDNSKAVLFILDAKTGALIKKIDTSSFDATPTTPAPPANGLSSPIAVDTDLDRVIDTVYAGDLHGNFWKFDLSSSNPASWGVANSKPLFVACAVNGATCTAANRQAITGKPNIGKHADDQSNGLMVYFGTGKYFETGDNLVSSSPQKQSFYGLWDQGLSITDRSQLQGQTITFEGLAINSDNQTSATGDLIRVVSKNTVCYAATSTGCTSTSTLRQGWVLDLVKPGTLGEGERMVSFPLVRRGLVIFATLIPNPDPCKDGGKSWLMELDASTGKQADSPAFDLFGGSGGTADGKVDGKDKVSTGTGTALETASGKQLDIGIHKMPSVIESDGVDYKYLSGSSAKIGKIVDAGAATSGARIAWRQLR